MYILILDFSFTNSEPTPRSLKPTRLLPATEMTPRSRLYTRMPGGTESRTPIAAGRRGVFAKESRMSDRYSDDEWLVEDGEGEEEESEDSESESESECEIVSSSYENMTYARLRLLNLI